MELGERYIKERIVSNIIIEHMKMIRSPLGRLLIFSYKIGPESLK